MHIRAVEAALQWFGGEFCQQRVLLRIAVRVQAAAEAARIIEAQRLAGIEPQIEMIVGFKRSALRQYAQ